MFEIQQASTTKREVLTTLASIYDPLGMLTSFTINMKIFIQNLWEKGLERDDKLNDKDKETWKKMTQDIYNLSSIQIPRFIGNRKSKLLCFCDSSNKAYAAAIYLRVVRDGKVSVNLLFSKSRNAPKKKLTIPRLELMSTLIGVRSLRFVANEMKLNDHEKILWTDSQCVLSWLKQEKNKDTFVRNRVLEIKGKDDITFRYINTKHNPADLPTRGMPIDELKESKLWWNGPEWLLKEEENWLLWNTDEFDMGRELQDNKQKEQIIFEISGAQPEIEEHIKISPFEIDEKRQSTLKKLLRVTAYANRFIKCMKTRQRLSKELTAKEIDEAEMLWIKYLQRKHYMTDMNQLNKEQKHSQLNPVIYPDEIIRLNGRYKNSDLPDETKFPILVPRNEHFTQLLIANIHERNCHAGVSHTLAQLRKKYWIPQGRTAIRQVIRNCLTCIRYQRGPY